MRYQPMQTADGRIALLITFDDGMTDLVVPPVGATAIINLDDCAHALYSQDRQLVATWNWE